MKTWAPEHVLIASAAADVRTKLRQLAERLVGHQRTEVIECIDHLTRALKARPGRAGLQRKRQEEF